jgi:hypothetical protein
MRGNPLFQISLAIQHSLAELAEHRSAADYPPTFKGAFGQSEQFGSFGLSE